MGYIRGNEHAQAVAMSSSRQHSDGTCVYDFGAVSGYGAVMAIDGKMAVQDVPYAKLRERLLQDRQILEYSILLR